jgi:acetylornithine/N-succinyldiaminopimelate aminotransferase
MVINTPTRTDTIIQGEAETIVQTYTRPPFVLVGGEGVTLYDSDGNPYTDWVAGIAVNALGYNAPEINAAIQAQLNTGMLHVSNLYHTAPHVALAQALTAHSFADRAFFCNSGTEANEAALKFARKWATSKTTGKNEIITFSGGFHGRTMGALAMTPREKYQAPFAPMMPGVRVATFNDLDSVAALISQQTAAVIVEPIQGEGGVNVADTAFLQGLRQLCDDHDALLIFDEVQCGVGRTGDLWAHQHSGITPDIMTLAKPLAGGLPIGAVLCTEHAAAAMQPGDHGSTFAGGPVVTAAALAVLERVNTPEFLSDVRAIGAYLLEKLQSLDNPHIIEVRGRGLMVACAFDMPVNAIIQAGYAHGLLLVNAGANVLRFVPPLIVTQSHVDDLIDKLTHILEKIDG